ncbi:cation-binding protein [Noviherbaspirillum denitrificans]|uniref:Cation-binding protein n=2 Tax=Noviherbaspirillum denitrificans TaxID=1968433 RepID=A0A254TQ25_9BURK|nr:cation-binding protein [Noviherbaspirillum denitrificans]
MKSLRNTLTSTLSPTITNMIRMDHTAVLETFHQYEIDTSPSVKKGLVNTACIALEIHAQLEEEIFYPAMRTVSSDKSVLEKSVPEHNEMRRLIAQLRSMDANNPAFDYTFMELMRNVLHHVADEETTLLPEAERLLGSRLSELGAEMTKRRLQLTAPRAGELASSTVRSFPASSMLVAAGAVLAGTYLAKRAFEGQGHSRNH